MISFAPCKINLGLQVIEKRNDGYHNLSSIFYPVGLHDIIEITEKKGLPSFTSTGVETYAGDDKNLCMKAYHMLATDYNLSPVHIHLHKQIPVGAGLGGGSSDASLVLKMLNQKFALNIPEEKLCHYASQIGSDCPFFIKESPQLVSGRGEILNKITLNLKGYFLLLIKPGIFVSTAEAYGSIKPAPASFDLAQLSTTDIENWKNYLVNDFEKPLFEKYTLLGEIKKFLYHQGAIYASMSGSGSALYGIFKNKPSDKVPFPDCSSFVRVL